MKSLRVWVSLLIWAGALAPIVGPAPVCAQSNPPFQNPALDSNCYFPQIGDPTEMDTILGSDSNQNLGSIIKNLGAKPNGGFGNMFIGNISPTVALAQVATGPGLNLHQMKEYAQNFDPELLYNGYHLGHFRDTKHLDLFVYPWRIYWSDDAGNYDSSNFTLLTFTKRGDYKGNGGLTTGYINPYITHLTSDSVDDIVLSFIPDFTDYTKDTDYLALFRGGISFVPKDTIFEDTSFVLYPSLPNNPWRYNTQGDFRGVGRDDLILADDSENKPGEGGNLWYFRNEPPFSLANLAQAILYDTLMAHWQNPLLNVKAHPGYSNSYFVMPALPHTSGDNSIDFLPVFFIDTQSTPSIFMFKGGQNFGLHRITLDSAAYVIHQPSIFQGDGWPVSIADAGDMTGTGNHVLYTSARNDFGDYWCDAFFVTGNALDNKIDIYNSHPYSEGPGDTLTANSDSLEDYLFPLGWPTAPEGISTAGSLWLYYGSKQIPVHLNPQWSEVKNIATQNGVALTLSPNPAQTWSVATIVWPVSEDGQYSIYDMLGRKLEHGPIHLYGGAEQQRIYFSGMPQGVYIYTIEGEHGSASARFVKLGGASGSTGTSQPSIIQQMKDDRDGKTDSAGLSSSSAPIVR